MAMQMWSNALNDAGDQVGSQRSSLKTFLEFDKERAVWFGL